ncbi:choline transport protein, partial [Lecanoromycetidae sp. Uapishka_2]
MADLKTNFEPVRGMSTASGFSGRKKSVAEEPVTSVLGAGAIPIYSERELTADEEVLAALGYKPEFKREFSLWTSFCVSFAVLGLLPSFASTLYYGMGYAGTPGMVWGWLIAMAFIQCVAMSMAEICSSMPTSGGLYYASAVLAPPGWGPLAAWLTGWSNWMAQVTGAPSVDYALSAMVLAGASISVPSYVPQNYQIFLLTAMIMIIHGCISSMPTKWIANFNSVGSTFNMIALCIVLILIPSATNREAQGHPRFSQASVVWGNFYAGTDFSNGVSLLMTFVAVIWTMSGYDAPFHLSEECSNANIAAPRAIVLTSGVGGLFGWFLQLVVAYTVIDIDAVITSDLGQPWASYLLQVLPQKVALAALSLTIIAAFSMGQGCMVAASRVTFAYARDGCFPCSWWIKRVNRYTHTPVNAVWFNTTLGILMTFLIFGGPLAAGALFSIAAVAAFVAFTIPIFIRVFFVGNRFRAGPWNLGRYSMYIGGAASCFVALMVPILCLPSLTGSDLTAAGMNWTCLVYGGPMTMVIIWWFVDAHKWFKGPKVNIEHQMLGREGNVVEGKGDDSEGSSAGSITKERDQFTDKKAADLA